MGKTYRGIDITENQVDYKNNITTITLEKPTRKLLSQFLRVDERIGAGLFRILKEYELLKKASRPAC